MTYAFRVGPSVGTAHHARGAKGARKPVVGVLCCNEVADRPVQVVASRFVEPLAHLSRASVILVPAITSSADTDGIVSLLDGLLLTGSRSHVAPERYGAEALLSSGRRDIDRDEVALRLSARMIELGKPVFGICRGLQELNVLFGGTLAPARDPGRHHRIPGSGIAYTDLFDHQHDVELTDGGRLALATGERRLTVNSVHEQVIDRLGDGLSVEALCHEDGTIEAIAARPCGGDVLGVQWHPEWDVASNPSSRAFFGLVGTYLRTSAAALV